MSSPVIDPARIRAAAKAVTEFGTVAFEEEFLRWERDVNLAVASSVWNFLTLQACGRKSGVGKAGVGKAAAPHSGTRPGLSSAAGEGDEIPPVPEGMDDLRDRLVKVRTTRWPEADWMVMAWHARVENGEIVFSFDLWWDEHEYCQPCEMTWVPRVAQAEDLS